MTVVFHIKNIKKCPGVRFGDEISISLVTPFWYLNEPYHICWGDFKNNYFPKNLLMVAFDFFIWTRKLKCNCKSAIRVFHLFSNPSKVPWRSHIFEVFCAVLSWLSHCLSYCKIPVNTIWRLRIKMFNSNSCQYFIFIFNSSLSQILLKEVIHLKQYFDDDVFRIQSKIYDRAFCENS